MPRISTELEFFFQKQALASGTVNGERLVMKSRPMTVPTEIRDAMVMWLIFKGCIVESFLDVDHI